MEQAYEGKMDWGEGTPERLVKLREALGFTGLGGQTRWANHLGIGLTTWNNAERGVQGVSKDVITKIIQKFPGITSDWIYFGNPTGLSIPMARLLGVLPEASGEAINGKTRPRAT